MSDFSLKIVPELLNLKIELEPSSLVDNYKNLNEKKEILNDLRTQIDNINSNTWKKIRWEINDYDFSVKNPIINRAFFKFWEISKHFNLYNEDYIINKNIVHLAEAPGGFIQVSNYFLKKIPNMLFTTDQDGFIKKEKHVKKIFSMSLNKNIEKYKKYNLPDYSDKIKSKNLLITYGKDNTGDITDINNILYLKNIISKNSLENYLITADGGFDEGTDFNNKEILHYNLILFEIISCIILSNENSNFVLKMYDIFTTTSINYVKLLSILFNEVYIYKPKTSRPTNSEKYLICKNMHKMSDNFKQTLINSLLDIQKNNYKIINNQIYFLEKSMKIIKDKVKTYCDENNKKNKYNEWVKLYEFPF
jgi:23S rRNA U2552 (ribose-2'-O)-methylase RlmE/FtsJ